MSRINFHGGDQLFWTLPGARNYRGRDRDWPDYLAAVIRDSDVTDLVLFGDCRPRHRAAIKVAGRLGVPVRVFEEGYLRPHWVTLESGGVNGHSDLPRDPGWYRAQAALLPPLAVECGQDAADPVVSSFTRRALEDLAYNFGYLLLGWSFPFHRTHRPWHPLVEYAGWGTRLLRRRLTRGQLAAEAAAAATLPDAYMFPLQLDCDSQVRQHSSLGGMATAIEMVLASFARHAPAGASLVVKEHPLDNGLRDWRRLVATTAARLGISARVRYIADGDLARLTATARGMVTVNSTSGTLALAAGVPVMTLGQAIYDLPGLTFQGPLDAFWTMAEPPDAALFIAFRRVLAHRCLVRGGFFSTAGVAMLTREAVARLEARAPGHAMAGAPAAATPRPGLRTAGAMG